jgi:hypothetical protein
MLTATPQGPTILDNSLAAAIAKTGYVSSINGEQGAVEFSPTGAPINVPQIVVS